MKLADVQKPLHTMNDAGLQKLQRTIRKNRMTTQKVEKVVKRRERKVSDKLEQMLKAMSPEERAKFVEAIKDAG